MYELSFVSLEHEDWPEWFTLVLIQGLDPTALPLPLSVPLLMLDIAEGPLHWLISELPKCHMLDDYKKRLKEYDIEANFLLDINKPWGFGGVLNPYQQLGHTGGSGFLKFVIPIPRVEKDAGECEDCDGTGENSDVMGCLRCNGTGRETSMDFDALDCIAATLGVLNIILGTPDKEWLAGIDTKRNQLLSVQTHFERGCAFIGANISMPFSNYLRRLSGYDLPEVEEAIRNVYLHMFPGYEQFADLSFRVRVQSHGQLIMEVPGNACSLYVDGMRRSLSDTSKPMRFDCHNVDGHHQQLTLLSGLAALSGMARRSLYPDQ